MTMEQWKDINSFVIIAAVIITGITIYLWLSKRLIHYTIAKRIIVISSLLTGISAGLGYGWIFSLLVTLLQTSVLYFIVEMANKEANKRQQDEKIRTDNYNRIL